MKVAEQEMTGLQTKINEQHGEIVHIQKQMNDKNVELERLGDGLKSTMEDDIKQKDEKIGMMEEEQAKREEGIKAERKKWEMDLSKKDDEIKILKDRVQALQDTNSF